MKNLQNQISAKCYAVVLSAVLLFFTGSFTAHAQSKIDPKDIRDKMQWFADAKLGIFIHEVFMQSMVLMNPGVFIIKK